jgi:hypothetical protein
MPRGTTIYALVKFSVCVAASAVFLWFGDDLSEPRLLALTALLLTALWLLGAAMQRRLNWTMALTADVLVLGIGYGICRFVA